MMNAGHEVYLYGLEGSDAPCTEFINIMTTREQERYFAKHDFTKSVFPIVWEIDQPYFAITNARAALEIAKRTKPKDFVCIIGGSAQATIQAGLQGLPLIVCEYGIGYYGTFAKFRAFESYSHMHHVIGKQSGYNNDPDGSAYDVVIPNYWDVEDFPLDRARATMLCI